MALPRWLQHVLDNYQVPYQEHQHLPVFSALRLAQAEHVSGHRVAKTVFLTRANHPIAVVLPASARLDLERAEAVLGFKDARLATEAEIAAWFRGCEPGSVPPLRLRSDQTIVMDRSLAHMGSILFPAGTSELAVSMLFRDWYRMVRPGIGRFAEPVNGKKATNGRPLVLVVEDESDTNHLFCRLLERRGFASLAAENAERALALASQTRPCAILLDLMLPDMSGLEMYERMRRVGPIKLPPAIVVTALDDDEMRQRGQRLGAEAYITKPFPPERLMRELEEVVADSGA
jgi:CheY-like chemotaxis protein/prolyl-tRNA editing enzyme YbaK/EbsC (Cys-tRNA(Pro) deacylase)